MEQKIVKILNMKWKCKLLFEGNDKLILIQPSADPNMSRNITTWRNT